MDRWAGPDEEGFLQLGMRFPDLCSVRMKQESPVCAQLVLQRPDQEDMRVVVVGRNADFNARMQGTVWLMSRAYRLPPRKPSYNV